MAQGGQQKFTCARAPLGAMPTSVNDEETTNSNNNKTTYLLHIFDTCENSDSFTKLFGEYRIASRTD